MGAKVRLDQWRLSLIAGTAPPGRGSRRPDQSLAVSCRRRRHAFPGCAVQCRSDRFRHSTCTACSATDSVAKSIAAGPHVADRLPHVSTARACRQSHASTAVQALGATRQHLQAQRALQVVDVVAQRRARDRLPVAFDARAFRSARGSSRATVRCRRRSRRVAAVSIGSSACSAISTRSGPERSAARLAMRFASASGTFAAR